MYAVTCSNPGQGSGSAGEWTELVAGSIPSRVICIWSGLIADIPSGWYLCDGTNGTPDMRGLFIVGAPAGIDPGDISGSNTHTHNDHAFTGTPASLTHIGSAVADHAAHTHSVTSNVSVADHADHTHNYTDIVNHTHPHNLQGGTSGSTTGTNVMGSAATGGSSRTMAIATSNPTGGKATGVTLGVNTTLSHAVTNNAVASGNPNATLTHNVTQPNAHSYTPVGTIDAHSIADNVPLNYAVAFIMKA